MNHLHRRDALRLGGAAVATSLAVACVPSAPAQPTPAAVPASGPLPTYLPPSGGPKPDFLSSDPRITQGFINYPTPVKAWTAAPPGSGGTLTVFVPAYYPQPTARDQDPTWKAVEQALNSTVNMIITAMADYSTRLQVVMAGNDLPDTIHIVGTVANLISPQFVDSQCADLSPYLSGDAARDYPNLAAIPGYAYQGAGGIFNNRLYGIPIQRYLPAFWFFRNSDIWDAEIGADVAPKDAADFKKILQQLNRPQESRWAIGNSANGPASGSMYGLISFLEMFGAPNAWSLDSSGKLVRDRETDQYKAAISYMKDLMGSGLYPPDFQTAGDSRSAFIAGRFVVSTEAFGNGWNDFWRRGLQQTPQRHYTIVGPFAADASLKPQHYLTAGTVAYNVLKKGSPDRVREVLRILNYLAAPFGSEEDLLLTYGLRDQDFSMDANGNPIPSQQGLLNAGYVPWQYLAHRPYAWYQSDLPGYAKAAFDVEQTLVGIGVTNPTVGLHSATQAKNAASEQAFYDGLADLLFNRRPFSDYDQLVSDWRTSVGDTIRQEYLSEIQHKG
ncbi:MAG: extracellular solute-binding protein [Chloroflexi bacterium]|nr:extracellular solute-binding protein [Chloroflexota bacterium]